MVNPFICGNGTFHHHSEGEEDDHFHSSSSPTATSAPRRSRKLWKTKDNHPDKNPYARFGRDKFSALLAELEDKRQEIYTQTGSEDISFVRFAYSNSNNCKPIVVKVRKREKNRGEHSPEGVEQNSTLSSAPQKEVHQPRIDKVDRKNKTKMKSEREIVRPFHYLVAIVVLIMLFLAVFGRSFAIILVALGWYLVPAIKERKESDKRRRKKKEHGTRESENKIKVSTGLSPPKSINRNVAVNEVSPRRKSW